jgi:hypothetical protein
MLVFINKLFNLKVYYEMSSLFRKKLFKIILKRLRKSISIDQCKQLHSKQGSKCAVFSLIIVNTRKVSQMRLWDLKTLVAG